jgi:hypothetical protein
MARAVVPFATYGAPGNALSMASELATCGPRGREQRRAPPSEGSGRPSVRGWTSWRFSRCTRQRSSRWRNRVRKRVPERPRNCVRAHGSPKLRRGAAATSARRRSSALTAADLDRMDDQHRRLQARDVRPSRGSWLDPVRLGAEIAMAGWPPTINRRRHERRGVEPTQRPTTPDHREAKHASGVLAR